MRGLDYLWLIPPTLLWAFVLFPTFRAGIPPDSAPGPGPTRQGDHTEPPGTDEPGSVVSVHPDARPAGLLLRRF